MEMPHRLMCHRKDGSNPSYCQMLTTVRLRIFIYSASTLHTVLTEQLNSYFNFVLPPPSHFCKLCKQVKIVT